ncbi:MAG: Bifunctional protein GlmU [Myxococcota bacterium]|nr:Bifunctional protein GlmU [Myxococcota bacterium]
MMSETAKQISPALAAVVMAAGKGTRMKSNTAKVLHAVAGKPMLEWVLDLALEIGCERAVAVVGHQAERVRAHVEGKYGAGRFLFAEQREQKGTGHAVMMAAGALQGFEGRVLILSGDVPLLSQETLKPLLEAPASLRVALLSMVLDDPTGYGRVIRGEDGRVRRIVEHKDATETERQVREVNSGVYLIDAALLLQWLPRLQPNNAQGEYYLTDLIRFAAEENAAAEAYPASPEDLGGINDRVQLAAASAVARQRILRRHMLGGVTIEDPVTTYIDRDVTIGNDAIIEPGAHLRGATSIGEGAVIGAGSVIINSQVGPQVRVQAWCHFEDAVVGPACKIGPYARLRPGAELSADCHIGNFVELKKARMGKGSKANHLAYLGDAEIGSGVNVGAGTITCNYDGKNKHVTRLADGVFVGSDTQFVAPVSVGAGAYIGAGSTITEDVPAGALAFTRAPQTVKEGWVRKKAERDALKTAEKKT